MRRMHLLVNFKAVELIKKPLATGEKCKRADKRST